MSNWEKRDDESEPEMRFSMIQYLLHIGANWMVLKLLNIFKGRSMITLNKCMTLACTYPNSSSMFPFRSEIIYGFIFEKHINMQSGFKQSHICFQAIILINLHFSIFALFTNKDLHLKINQYMWPSLRCEGCLVRWSFVLTGYLALALQKPS